MKTTRGGTFGTGYNTMKWAREQGYVLIEDGDAPFRFVWLNKATRTVLTYCEGDLITEECESDTELTAHLAKLRAFYGSLDEEVIAA